MMGSESPLGEFAPAPRRSESVRSLPSGGWRWACACGFTATCLEDVGYHRGSCPAFVDLPKQWQREGMVVVVDSMSGELIGCMGRESWEEQVNG